MEKFFKIKSKRNQFICSVFSAIFYLLGYSCIMECSNFSVYFISYIHYKQTWVNMQYGNLMRPVVLLFLSCFSPLSGAMEHLFGPRIALFTSALVIEIVFVFFFFQRNLWIFYFLSLFLGLGCGLSANITVKNCCLFYPKKKGFISACIMSLGALIGSSYTLLGEKIINPDRKGATNSDGDPYYPTEVAERSKYFFLFSLFLLPLATSISLFLFYKYEPSCEKENIKEEKIEKKVDDIKGPLLEVNIEEEKDSINNEKEEIKETKEEQKNNNIKKEEEKYKNESKDAEKVNVSNSFMKPAPKENIKKALKTWRFWRNILISGVMPFGLYFIMATCRAYASLLDVDGSVIGTLAGFMNIIGSACNPVWAFCTDKYGFQPVMKILSIATIALPIYFFIFLDSKLFYVIGLYISCCFRGGVIACITPHIMHIFGLRYYLTLGGFGRLFNQLFNFLIAMLSIIISIWNDTAKELLQPYRIVCAFGVIIAVIGFTFVFYETDEKFKFDDDEKEPKKEKKKKNKKEEETEQDKKQEQKENLVEEEKYKTEGQKENLKVKEIDKQENIEKEQKEKKEEEINKNEGNLENKEEMNENNQIENDEKKEELKKEENEKEKKNEEEKENKEENRDE